MVRPAVPIAGEFVGKLHNHGCTRCRRRYQCACRTPETNGVCNVCVSGRLPLWVEGWSPHPCCFENEPISPIWDKNELRTYKLAGPGPWFRCPTCSRTMPCQPSEMDLSVSRQ